MFSPTEEASLLKGINNDYERLVSKSTLDATVTATANEESLCLEGGHKSTLTGLDNQSDDL